MNHTKPKPDRVASSAQENDTPLAIARGYLDRGWMPLPLLTRDKNPGNSIGAGWQDFRVTDDTVGEHFNGAAQNIGLLLGDPSNGLADLDLDVPEAVAVAPAYVPATYPCFGRRSNPSSHYLYNCPGLTTEKLAFRGKMIVEIRGTGCQTVMPGSLHDKTGEPITWHDPSDPITVDEADLKRAARRIAAAAIIARAWPDIGGRHNAALALAGGLARAGWAQPDAEKFIEVVCNAAGCKDIQTKMSGVGTTFKKIAAGEKATGWKTLKDALGGDVLDKAREWLGIRAAVGEPGQIINLPCDYTTITDSAAELGKRLAEVDYYTRAGQFARVTGREIELIEDDHARSIFEDVGILCVKKVTDGGELYDAPKRCSKANAQAIVAADPFRSALPPIKAVTHCPALLPDGRIVTGYDRDAGIYAMGKKPDDAPLDDAVPMLLALLDDFNFSTEADRSRAVAAMLNPAFVNGQLLGEDKRVPGTALEADASQSGKGYAVRLIAALYGTTPQAVSQKQKGVGGIEESMSRHLIAGAPIIALDNLRGKVDVPWLESAMTEPLIDCRVPYAKPVGVDPRRTCIMLTSNRAELTPDLSNRFVFIRINKHEDGHEFKRYDEGDLIEHVRANQSRYLGAVYSVLKRWIELGRPGEPDGRHDLRAWAGAVRWIVTELFNLPDPLDGHREIQRRTASESANWLRDVCLAVAAEGRMDAELRAHDLLDLLVEAEVEVPGMKDDADPDDERTRDSAMRGIGRRMSAVFKKSQAGLIEVDRFDVERVESQVPGINGKPIISYRFLVREPASTDLDIGLPPF